MVAVQIRDVPDHVRDALAREAKAQGIPLQTYLQELLEVEARSARNRQFLRTFRPIRGTTSAEPVDIPELIHQSRKQRDRDIMDVVDGQTQ